MDCLPIAIRALTGRAWNERLSTRYWDSAPTMQEIATAYDLEWCAKGKWTLLDNWPCVILHTVEPLRPAPDETEAHAQYVTPGDLSAYLACCADLGWIVIGLFCWPGSVQRQHERLDG